MGQVYDENGSLVSNGTVHVTSLNTSNPFDTTVNVTSGSYVVNAVPAGVQLSVTATAPNWTSRTRVTTLLPLSVGQSNTMNFGGPFNVSADPNGAAYFISKYPEVVSVNPADGAYIDPSKLTYQVTFSEPFDATNRARITNGFYIQAPNPLTGNGAPLFITIQNGSTFLNTSNVAQVTWDATGTVMTLTFNAPLTTNANNDQTYTASFSRASNDQPIVDANGNTFGFTAPPAGTAYSNVVAMSTPTLNGTETTAVKRWNDTHAGSVTFKLHKDTTQPVLTGVSDTTVQLNGTTNTRFDLKFSKPMVTYPSTSSFSSTAFNLGNYIFALSQTTLSGTTIPGTTANTVTAAADAQTAMTSVNPFTFTAASGATVAFSVTDPTVISVYVPQSIVPSQARYFKVRVNNVQDPAGNTVSTANPSNTDATADNIKQASF